MEEALAQNTLINNTIDLSEDGSILNSKIINGNNNKNSMIVLEENNLSAQDRIDYGPVHRCCQIFNVLVCFEL